MRRVKVLPSKMAGLNRYRCDCGHCEDRKDDKGSTSQRSEMAILRALQKTP